MMCAESRQSGRHARSARLARRCISSTSTRCSNTASRAIGSATLFQPVGSTTYTPSRATSSCTARELANGWIGARASWNPGVTNSVPSRRCRMRTCSAPCGARADSHGDHAPRSSEIGRPSTVQVAAPRAPTAVRTSAIRTCGIGSQPRRIAASIAKWRSSARGTSEPPSDASACSEPSADGRASAVGSGPARACSLTRIAAFCASRRSPVPWRSAPGIGKPDTSAPSTAVGGHVPGTFTISDGSPAAVAISHSMPTRRFAACARFQPTMPCSGGRRPEKIDVQMTADWIGSIECSTAVRPRAASPARFGSSPAASSGSITDQSAPSSPITATREARASRESTRATARAAAVSGVGLPVHFPTSAGSSAASASDAASPTAKRPRRAVGATSARPALSTSPSPSPSAACAAASAPAPAAPSPYTHDHAAPATSAPSTAPAHAEPAEASRCVTPHRATSVYTVQPSLGVQ
jgi:hypothetical protein